MYSKKNQFLNVIIVFAKLFPFAFGTLLFYYGYQNKYINSQSKKVLENKETTYYTTKGDFFLLWGSVVLVSLLVRKYGKMQF